MKRTKTFDGMQMRTPASRWQDALPCGNGTIGAMVYGHIRHELILLNHEALWFRTPKPVLPDISDHVPELRKRLFEGDYRAAGRFLWDKLIEAGAGDQHIDSYHPAFDLDLSMENRAAYTSYCRGLQFNTGEATVQWTESGTSFDRRLFVSRADDVVVLRITREGPGPIQAALRLSPHEVAPWDDNWFQPGQSPADLPLDFRASCPDGSLEIVGRYRDGGEFGGVARVIQRRGTMRTEKGAEEENKWIPMGPKMSQTGLDKIRIDGAEEVLVLVKLFANEPSGPALARLREELGRLDADYEGLLTRHREEHERIFRRTTFQLAPSSTRCNEDLLGDASDGDVSALLMQRMVTYGRYLLLSSSRPGGWPANLQGVWNGNYMPAWSADYHNDENVQMCYWQTLAGNMPETLLPYIEFYESRVPDWRENAQKVYGCRGILAPISESTHGLIFPGAWMNWTAGAGWIAQLFFDYWLFTGDRDFLRKRVIPFLTEVARFYEDFLVEDAAGRYVFAPSLSPENVPDIEKRSLATINATMDVAVAREVLSNLCTACEELGMQNEDTAKWEAMLSKLPSYEINEDGALREWLHPGLKDNYHHRHQSHIYPVFPGHEINAEDEPTLFKAARVAVEKRLVVGLQSQTGWSFAHMASIYARLGEGNRALECLELLVRACTGPNLFTYLNDWRGQGLSMFWGHRGQPPFQLDANLGLTAAVQEMLLTSRPGFLALLPALPDKWTKGRMQGLCARGGIHVFLRWAKRILKAELRSSRDQVVTVRTRGEPLFEQCRNVHAQDVAAHSGFHYAEIVLQKGKRVVFVARQST